MIVALSRYGGLRCPSEVLSLRWQDVDWEGGRIVVQSPKTEHHVGKATRTIPLFAELRPILAEAFYLASEGAAYVVDGNHRDAANTASGWRNCNLRTQFERIVKRAGLTPWPRLFHARRASRETELAKDYPIHVVTSWLGNTPRIALKHYLQVTDADFERAAASAESGALSAQNAAQPGRAAKSGESHESGATPVRCASYAASHDIQPISAQTFRGEDRIGLLVERKSLNFNELRSQPCRGLGVRFTQLESARCTDSQLLSVYLYHWDKRGNRSSSFVPLALNPQNRRVQQSPWCVRTLHEGMLSARLSLPGFGSGEDAPAGDNGRGGGSRS
ncbi:MAG: site-specific integrase [Pirellulales bacterium]